MEENLNESKTQEQTKKNPFNKTLLLVVGLVILTGVLLFISLSQKNPSIPGITREEKEDTSFAHTSLVLSEEPRASSISGVYEVDVIIDSEDNQVTGAQLELSYDPKVLGRVDIKPGTFLSNPVVILKKIDNTSGRITYMLGNQLGDAGVKGKGIIATLSFSKLSSQETSIEFLPQTLVTAQGFDQSVLRETVSTTISTPSAF